MQDSRSQDLVRVKQGGCPHLACGCSLPSRPIARYGRRSPRRHWRVRPSSVTQPGRRRALRRAPDGGPPAPPRQSPPATCTARQGCAEGLEQGEGEGTGRGEGGGGDLHEMAGSAQGLRQRKEGEGGGGGVCCRLLEDHDLHGSARLSTGRSFLGGRGGNAASLGTGEECYGGFSVKEA
jgi:hypothetical protein